jgi:pimeloyl-ACP methyl ester carboxylesterase
MSLVTLVAVAAVMPVLPDPKVGDGGVAAFYQWSSALPDEPGKLLRQEPLEAELMVPGASRGVRILYTSTDGMDDHSRTAVSAAVFLPAGRPPQGGWPIVAWAHGTTGVADVCAPSQLPRSPRDREFLGTWLKQNYAIVATDYQGLGTAGPHPYILYRPEAYSVLDSVRAALTAMPGTLRNKVVAIGQSQGSGAALGTALLAPTYAPDLKYLGTVAMGLVARVADPAGAPQVPLPKTYAADADAAAAYEMLFLAGTGRVVDPTIDLDKFVSDAGKPLLHAARTSCMTEMTRVAKVHGLTTATIFNESIARVDAIEPRYGAFPSARITTPVLTATGLLDRDASTASQYNFVSAMCHAGTHVQWHYYPGQTHMSTVMASLVDSVPFVSALMAGKQPPSNCSTLQPPPP